MADVERKLLENRPREWAWLPKNVLDVILEKVVSLSDYARFSAVCKPWLSVAIDHKQRRLNSCLKQLPLLLVPTKDGSQEWRSLYSATEEKPYDFKLYIPMNKRCCGSSHGWLCFVKKEYSITLFNPFTGGVARLPPFRDVYEGVDIDNDQDYIRIYPYDVDKAILSADPCLHPDNCTVVLIDRAFKRIAYLKLGDPQWKNIVYNERTYCHDVIYYKGLVYAFCSSTAIVCFDVSGDSPGKLKTVVPLLDVFTDWEPLKQFYLVESSRGDLWIVRRFLELDEEIEISYKHSRFLSSYTMN